MHSLPTPETIAEFDSLMESFFSNSKVIAELGRRGWVQLSAGQSPEDKAQALFMEASNQSTNKLNVAQTQLYIKLVEEEFNEFMAASKVAFSGGAGIDASAITSLIDGAFDLVVTAKGTLLSLGAPVQKIIEEGWASNLAKIDPATGTVKKREDGKVLKPTGWQPPDFAKFNPLLFNNSNN